MNTLASKEDIKDFFFSRKSFLSTNFDSYIKLFRIDFDNSYFHADLFKLSSILMPNSIAGAVTKRQAEYLSGRYAAKKTLSALGVSDYNVLTGKHRSPIWPKDIIASITHTNNTAICAGGLSNQVRYLGIDLENWIQHNSISEIKDIIIIKTEERLAIQSDLGFDCAFTLIFSAKESLFKALYPSVGYYFDFSAAELVEISTEEKSFIIRLREDLTRSLIKGTQFTGCFEIMEETVLTIILKRTTQDSFVDPDTINFRLVV